MKEVGGQSELWLVKSGDRIYGPFEHSEVIKKLLSREFAVIDEIAKPLSRWKYVREEPAFLAVVEQIRAENLNARDDTMATITTTPTPVIDPMDLTPTPTQIDLPTQFERPLELMKNERPQKRYGLRREVETTPQRNSSLPLLIALFLALGMGGVWFLRTRPGHSRNFSNASFSSLKRTGLSELNSGDYRASLKTLKEAQNLDGTDPEVQLAVASLLLKVENQTAAARRMVGDIANPSEDQKKRSDLILSYADLVENEPLQAIDHLKSYDTFETDVDRAIAFNKAVAFELAKKNQAAEKTLQPILSDHRYGPPSRLLLALITADENQEIAIENLKPVVDSGSYRPRPFQQEALVLQSYLHIKAKNKKAAEASITSALTADPYATSLFTYDPSLYVQAVNWVRLRTYCEKIENEYSKSVEAKTLMAICELKSDRQAHALQLMTEAISQAPQDQLLLANNAYLLLEFGKDDDAKGSLRLAMRNSDSMQTLLLMAKSCSESGDVICERESYKKVLHLDPHHLTALVGLAELELKAGDAEAALKHYKDGIALDPSFAPLLRLKEKLP